MENLHHIDPWFCRFREANSARMRLFCFPYAGGGASIYRTWPQRLPADVDLVAVQPPGREGRLREPPFDDLSELLDAILEQIVPWLDAPFAFFGHSMGALVAFELSVRLQERSRPLPSHLFVSARRAPSVARARTDIHRLSDDAFIELMRRRYQAIPDAVLKEPELVQLLLPTVRADMAVVESCSPRQEPMLNVPVTAFVGDRDPDATPAEMKEWRKHTAKSFACREYEGGHFFIREKWPEMVATVVQTMERENASLCEQVQTTA